MSSTYSSGKMVAAFKADNGKAYYIGYEKVCSSNTYPREPKWHCTFIGDERDAISSIFSAASYIPGGMLKGANGRSLNPETYIASWLRELANPVGAFDLTARILNGGSWKGSWDTAAGAELRQTLTALGTPKAMEFMECAEKGETITLSLIADIDLILSMYGVNGLRGPSSLLQDGDLQARMRDRGQMAPELGVPVRKAKPASTLAPSLISVGETYPVYLAPSSDGTWSCVGYESCAMRDFIRQLAEHELTEPGTYRHHILAYRQAMETAPVLKDICDRIEVIVDTKELDWRDKANLESLLKEVPHTKQEEKVRFQLTFPGVHYSMIGYIPTEHSRWLVPDLQNKGASQPAEQLALIA